MGLKQNKYSYYNGKYHVRVLKKEGFTTTIKLLEPYSLRTPSGMITLPIGYVLHVGYWQVRDEPWEWDCDE
jgi:hypothetical protein